MKIDEKIITKYFEKLKKENYTKLELFQSGWTSCLQEQEKQKELKKQRKNKKLILSDYFDKTSSYNCAVGVYHDEGKQVITNGFYLLIHYAAYPIEYEGKIIDGEGREIDINYVDYKRAIPSNENMTEYNGITKEDIAIISRQFSEKSFARQKEKVIAIITKDFKIAINLCILKRLNSFLATYPEAVLYIPNNNPTRITWKVKDSKTKDEFVFIALAYNEYNYNQYIYSTIDKILTEQK